MRNFAIDDFSRYSKAHNQEIRPITQMLAMMSSGRITIQNSAPRIHQLFKKSWQIWVYGSVSLAFSSFVPIQVSRVLPRGVEH